MSKEPLRRPDYLRPPSRIVRMNSQLPATREDHEDQGLGFHHTLVSKTLYSFGALIVRAEI